jgi:PAS domain-containing protein
VFKGYEESEIIGEHFSRFYTEEERATGLPQRALQTTRREGKLEAEAGAYASTAAASRDREGNLVCAKVTRDLTERRAAEEELRKSQEQFRHLVQGVTDYAISLLDPKRFVSGWNSRADRINYKPEESSADFSAFYTEEDRTPACRRSR